MKSVGAGNCNRVLENEGGGASTLSQQPAEKAEVTRVRVGVGVEEGKAGTTQEH